MKKFFVLIPIAFLAFFLGCDEMDNGTEMDNGLDIIDDVIDEQADTSIPQWYRAPHKDIVLQVPDHLLYNRTRHPGEPIRDSSLVLPSRFVMSADRIYLSDFSGMNVHAFDFDGVMIEEEKMSRPSLSVRPPKNDRPDISFRSTRDEAHGLIISDDSDLISQIITGEGENLVTWFIQRGGEHQHKKFQPARDGNIAPVFYMDGLMYTLETGLENHLPNFILYGYQIPSGFRIKTIGLENDIIIDRPFFVTPYAFVTEAHIYVSYWHEENGENFNVWTKDGKHIGKCDVIHNFESDAEPPFNEIHHRHLKPFHYHRHSKTLYAADDLALQSKEHRYILIAFQQK